MARKRLRCQDERDDHCGYKPDAFDTEGTDGDGCEEPSESIGAGCCCGGCDWFTDWFTDFGLYRILVCRMRPPSTEREQRCNQQHEGAGHRRKKARAHWRVATRSGDSLGLKYDEKSAPAEGEWHCEIG